MPRGAIALFRPLAPDYRRYDGAAIIEVHPAQVESWHGAIVDIVLATGDRLTAYGEEIVLPAPPAHQHG